MKILVLMVGPQGSGKSTYCNDKLKGYVRISQDELGKSGHMKAFNEAIKDNEQFIVVDRINHDKNQRSRYLTVAKKAGYITKIIWINLDSDTCLKRCLERKNHPSINKDNAQEAIEYFFKYFQIPSRGEADELLVLGNKPSFARCDDICQEIGNRRHIIVGDIHGCLDELKILLDQLNFDPNEDVLISAGDLVDRGPKVKETLEYVMSLPRFYSVKGNHDDKFVRYADGKVKKLTHGIITSIESFDNKIPKEIVSFLRKLPFVLKTPSGYVVHAGFNPEAKPEEQNFADCMYMRYYGGKNYFDDLHGTLWYKLWPENFPRVFFGHIPDPSGPCTNNIVSLDGGCVFGDYLKAFDSKDGLVHYVNALKVYSKSEYGEAMNNKFDEIKKREEYAVAGLIRLDRSDDKKLSIYTYTDQCVFERMWDEVTSNSRGHIFNMETGECVARPFPKFFNLGENPENSFEKLPWDQPYEIYEKMDGWLGVLYRDDKKIKVASRGSFHSSGADWATQFIQSKDLSFLADEVTLVFEIIQKNHKIILPYPEDTLVVLAAFDRHTGEEFPRVLVEAWAEKAKLPIVKKYTDLTIHDCIKIQKDTKDREGFVIRFKDGRRVKVKLDWYCQIAKMLANLSPISTWEAMKNGKVREDFISVLPEEVRPLAETYKEHLESQYNKLLTSFKNDAQVIVSKFSSKKDMAIYMEQNKVPKPIRAIAFMLSDGNLDRAEKVIMDMIYPSSNEFQVITLALHVEAV